MFPHTFRPSAEKDLSKLPPNIRARIVKKLEFYLSQTNPLIFAESLVSSKIGDYRFQVGNYRVIFDLKDNKIIFLRIGHRKDIYK